MGQLVRDEEDQMQLSAAHGSISCRMMSTQTVLDHIIFRLTPTRTRFDLYVVAGSMTEKLASGLVTPFLCHLQTAEEQFRMGGYSIKLDPDDGHGHSANVSSWFTKGTVDRFVRFVNSPDVIERVITIESEIVELEDRIGMQTGLDRYPTAITAADDSLSVAESPSSFSTQQDHWKAMSVTDRTSYSTRIRELHDNGSTRGKNSREQLIGALDARRFILQKEQGMAFARAAAAGFVLVHLMQLIVFSDCFRALRLKEACTKFVTLCQKRQMAGFCSVDAIDEDLVAAVTKAGCALLFMSEKQQCKDQTCRTGEPEEDLTIKAGPPKDWDDDDAEDDDLGSRNPGHRSSTAATAKEFAHNGYDIKDNSSLFRHGQRSNQGCFKVFPDHEHISDSGLGKDCDDDTAASLRTNGHRQSSTAAGQIRPDASCATKGDPFLSRHDEHCRASRRQEMGFNDLFEHPAFFRPQGTCRSPPQPATVSPHLRRLRMRASNDVKIESPNHFKNSISHGRDEFEKRQNKENDHGTSTDGTESSLHLFRTRQSPGRTEDLGMSLSDMVVDEHASPSLQKWADGADFRDCINPRMGGVKKASPVESSDSERETESSRSSDSRLQSGTMICVAPVSGRRENAPAFDRTVMAYDTVSVFSDQERDRSPGRISKKRLEFEEPEKALCRQEGNNVNKDVHQDSQVVCSQRLPQDLRIQNACFEMEDKQDSHIYDMMSKIALMVNSRCDAKEAEDEGEEEEEEEDKQIRSPSESIHVMENGVAAADQAHLPSPATEVSIQATEERVKRFVDQYNEKKKEVKWRGTKKGPECSSREKTWKLVLEKKKEEMAKAKRTESLGRATGVEDPKDDDGMDRRYSSVNKTINNSIARAKSRSSASVFGSSVGWHPSSSPRGLASASANRIGPSALRVSTGIAADLDNTAHDQVTFPASKGRNMPSSRSADLRIAPASRSSISDGRTASIAGNERGRALNPTVLPARSPMARTFPAVKKECAVAATTTVSWPTDADVCQGFRPPSAKPGDTVSPKTIQKDSARMRPLSDKKEDAEEDLEEGDRQGRRTFAKSCDQVSVGPIELANAGARRATDGKAANGDAKFGIDARKFRYRRARGYGDDVREQQADDLISDQNLIRSRGKTDQIRSGSNQHNIDEDLVVANTGAQHATGGDDSSAAVVDDGEAKCEIDGRKEHRFDAADPLPTMLITDQDLQKRVIRLRSEEEAMDQIQSACADEEDHDVIFAPAPSVDDDRHRSVQTISSPTKADIQLTSFGRPFLPPAAMSARSIASERGSAKASGVQLASAVQSSLGAMAAVLPADSASLVQRSSPAVSAVMPDSPPPNCCWASIANVTPPFKHPLHRILHTHSISSRSRPKLQSNPAFSTRQDPSIATDDHHASKCLPSLWRNAHRRGALTVPVGHENSDASEAGDGTKQQSDLHLAQRCASEGRNASKSRSRSSLMRCMRWSTKEDSEAEGAAAERGRKQWQLGWTFQRRGCAREVGVVVGG